MIPCAVFKCHHPATHGAIYRHESNGATAHPVYYYCDQHAETRLASSLETWKGAANG